MLVDKMHGIKANAAATERRSPLRSVTTASEGFDSTAVCVLAREIGIRKAITIIGREDGRGIGRQLGLKVVARHRAWSGWLRQSVSQEFYAMPVGHNRALGLFEQDLTDAVLFGGHSGDGIWSLEDYYQNLDLLYPAMNTVGALPLLEFRLRVGLVLVPVPAIGIWHWPAVTALSHSAAMRAFREPPGSPMGSRPIPRRIGLEAGLDAEAFGRRKIAGGIAPPETFLWRGRRDFARFLRGIPDPTATDFDREEFPAFHGSPYRWTMHWAHRDLSERYR